MKLKKLLIISTAAIFLMSGVAIAGSCGKSCLQEVNPFAGAYPEVYKSNGYSTVYAGGSAEISGYAQGTQYAKGEVGANGCAFGDSLGFAIDTPHLKVGAIGALSKVDVSADGWVKGDDRRSGDKTDYAQIDIDLSGKVYQDTFIMVGGGINGFSGFQYSAGGFEARDQDYDHGTFLGWDSWDDDAFAADFASGEALAGGGTIGVNINTPSFALGGAITTNFANWDTNSAPYYNGGVDGAGNAGYVASSRNGQVAGTAAFCYEGYNNGSGIAIVGGMTRTIQGANFMNVKSTSFGYASSSVEGGGQPR